MSDAVFCTLAVSRSELLLKLSTLSDEEAARLCQKS